MEAILWKINRLRAMGLGEVLWRLAQAASTRLEMAGIGLANKVDRPLNRAGKPHISRRPAVDAGPYCRAADRLLKGRYDVFSLQGIEIGFPPQWNRDPRSGTLAPLTFGKGLNYRDEKLVGDIKYLWEPNRHLELVTLAQAFSLTAELRYAQAVRTMLSSWFEQCPYPMGPNWTSSLEHAVRLLNWSYTWHLLGGEQSPIFSGDEGARFRRDWLDCIYRHLHFVQGHFSRYSSANNHLLGEYMGLFVGSVTWPLWRDCAAWRDLAKTGFEHEALRQNCSDGVNREQATWYHHEVADMMVHCGLVGRANGIEFSVAYWDRLTAMLEYIASIMDVSGHLPMFGDSDDAVMVRLSQEQDFDVYRSLLATGAVLFGRGDFKMKARRFDDKSRWLLGDGAEERFEALSAAGALMPVRREFPEGGYWVLGDHFETEKEVRLVADAGPLGYLSIAAHGHADALSFTLSVHGREMLVDPGTYAYHTQKAWRDYFRSTAAHNTVRVEGKDQSVIGGNFLWLRQAEARCEKFATTADRDEWQGSHDGYRRLANPVRHRRSIVLDKRAAEVRIADLLEGTGRHFVEIFWHFAEDCVIRPDQGAWRVRSGNTVIRLSVPEGFEAHAVRGAESPPLGWISRRFDDKEPISTLVVSGHVEAGTPLITVIEYGISE